MGYYAEYFSTLLKGPWATSIKERFEARRAINNLSSSDKKLYKQLPQLVEKEHRITRALKEEKKTIENLRKAVENGYSLAFNVSTMDLAVLDSVNSLNEAWHKLNESISRRNLPALSRRFAAVNEIFGKLMHKAMSKAQNAERDEYKDILVLISQNQDHQSFMESVRLRFQSLESQSILAKFAIRSSIAGQRRDLQALKKFASQCQAISKGLIGKANELEIKKALDEMEKIATQGSKVLEDAFMESYKIKRRDFILMMKAMVNADFLDQLNKKWVQMHFMPEAPVKENDINIAKIKAKVSKEFHTIAQALRISISKTQQLDRKIA